MRGMRFGFGLGGGGLAGEGVGNVVVGAGVNVDAALCTKIHTMRAVTLWWIMVCCLRLRCQCRIPGRED